MRAVQREEQIFKKYYKSLCHFAWQMLRDVQMSEDIVQDTFIVYFNKKNSIPSDELAIKNFLYTSVRFACYNTFRRDRVDSKYILSLSKEESYNQEIELQIIKAEVLTEIYKIVETMPDSCRRIFKKGYMEGFSVKEIAEELGISVSTVKTQQSRALKVIMSNLNPEYLSIALLFLH